MTKLSAAHQPSVQIREDFEKSLGIARDYKIGADVEHITGGLHLTSWVTSHTGLI